MPRQPRTPFAVWCPTCRASAGEPCTITKGKNKGNVLTLSRTHEERVDLFRQRYPDDYYHRGDLPR